MVYGSVCLCFAVAIATMAIFFNSDSLGTQSIFEHMYEGAGCKWTGGSLYKNYNYRNKLTCSEIQIEKVRNLQSYWTW